MSYTKVDDVVQGIWLSGVGSMLAKIDINNAYRVVPVHPVDRHLLATAWRGKLFVDIALPFGLRSAPKIFTALADALEYVIKQHGVEHLWHYLDDYITVRKHGCEEHYISRHITGHPSHGDPPPPRKKALSPQASHQ